MKVIHALGWYFPDSVGGTEVYVARLVKELQRRDVACRVAAPTVGAGPVHYAHEGTDVFGYPVPRRWRRDEVQGKAPPKGFGAFVDWLREQQADIYHQHSWTSACGPWHLRAAKQLGLKTVLTIHVPGPVCIRGTMLREGREACDGRIEPAKCASCWLQAKGMAPGVAGCLAALPQGLAPLAAIPRVGPALAASGLVRRHRQELLDMAAAAEKIVAVCGWLHDALAVNGVPVRKLNLNRQGVADPELFASCAAPRPAPGAFSFGFLGRWEAIKGVHVLVEAFRRIPQSVAAELRICAVANRPADESYRDAVQHIAGGDRRIHFLPPAPPHEVPAFLRGLDWLAVPSQWLETGPLVALEAMAARTPVIGSRLGGIKELVRHERNGLLVPFNDVDAWTAALIRASTSRDLVDGLRNGIEPVRSVREVASDTISLYEEITGASFHAA